MESDIATHAPSDHAPPPPALKPEELAEAKRKKRAEETKELIRKKWQEEEKLTIEQRRKRYACGSNFKTLDDIMTWEKHILALSKGKATRKPEFKPSAELNRKVSLYHGNIVALEIDAIQNAANESLLGGGGIDGAIHSAAGDALVDETRLLDGCRPGETKISRGYNLPAKFVLHTVGPRGERPEVLKSSYQTTLDVAKAHGVRSIALCCVSTGIFGYPLVNATHVALRTVREWLETDDNKDAMDRIIFVCYLAKEFDVYEDLMPAYFPLAQEERKVATEFVWPWGGYRVEIAGSFSDWKPLPMNFNNFTHTITIDLPPGTHQYKFIIDGEWKYNGEKPTCKDPLGNTNNFIMVD